MLSSVAGMVPRRQRQAIARVSVSALVAALPLLYVSLRRPPPAALAGDTAFWFLMSNCVVAAIVATADDALFFGWRPSKDDDDDAPACRDEGGGVAVSSSPLAAVVSAGDELAAAVNLELEGARVVGGDVATTVATRSNSMDMLLLNHTIQQGEDDDDDDRLAIGKPSADTALTVEGREIDSPAAPASDEAAAIPVGKPAGIIIKDEPDDEPERPKLVTSKNVPEEEAGATEEEKDWPPDVVLAHQDKNVAAGPSRDGRLRRSVTEGCEHAAEESSEYWELSDEELNRRVENFIARFNREMRLQMEQEAAGVRY